MTREEKGALIDELAEKFKENQSFYITDSNGMSVAKINDFRRMCFDKGVQYKVYKNTFIRKALEKNEVDTTEFGDVLKGFSGIMFAGENANISAKILQDFRKKDKNSKLPLLKAASIENELIKGDDKIEYLSNLKSKNELIADVVALLQSPAKNVISALKSGQNTLAGLLKTLEEKES